MASNNNILYTKVFLGFNFESEISKNVKVTTISVLLFDTM